MEFNIECGFEAKEERRQNGDPRKPQIAFAQMLNLLKNDKVLSNLFGGMKYSFYFCISIFDKLINEINK